MSPLASAGFDLDASSLGFLSLGQRDGQHTVPQFGRDRIAVHVLRQLVHPREAALASLLAVPRAAFPLGLFALAFDRQMVVAGDEDFQVAQIKLGKFRVNVQLVVVLPIGWLKRRGRSWKR